MNSIIYNYEITQSQLGLRPRSLNNTPSAKPSATHAVDRLEIPHPPSHYTILIYG